MSFPNLDRRKLLKVSIGGVTAAYLAVPARFLASAQDAPLAFTGDIEFWDWEFAPARPPKTRSSRTGKSATPTSTSRIRCCRTPTPKPNCSPRRPPARALRSPTSTSTGGSTPARRHSGPLSGRSARLGRADQHPVQPRTRHRQHLHLDLLVLHRSGLLQHRAARRTGHHAGIDPDHLERVHPDVRPAHQVGRRPPRAGRLVVQPLLLARMALDDDDLPAGRLPLQRGRHPGALELRRVRHRAADDPGPLPRPQSRPSRVPRHVRRLRRRRGGDLHQPGLHGSRVDRGRLPGSHLGHACPPRPSPVSRRRPGA